MVVSITNPDSDRETEGGISPCSNTTTTMLSEEKDTSTTTTTTTNTTKKTKKKPLSIILNRDETAATPLPSPGPPPPPFLSARSRTVSEVRVDVNYITTTSSRGDEEEVRLGNSVVIGSVARERGRGGGWR